MKKPTNYNDAVEVIKTAILNSQFEAIKSVNEKQLKLYFGIGKYISENSRNGHFGEGALKIISERLDREMPGLRGFSERNLKYMRSFYEQWAFLEKSGDINSKQIQNIQLWQSCVPNCKDLSLVSFCSISFTHHREIITRVKNINERIFYINKSANERLSYRELVSSIENNDYARQGTISNNFEKTLKPQEAIHAIGTFKDQYALEFINTEELNVRDLEDIDERVLENRIVHNIKNFILTFGKGFAFIGNQYHIEAIGVDHYIDLLFFNRELRCLVAIELKTGGFKSSYLGQLSSYLRFLDDFEKLPEENPSIGIILCKNYNKNYVDYVINDYVRPMGVATYTTSKDMSKQLQEKLPSVEELRMLLDSEDEK